MKKLYLCVLTLLCAISSYAQYTSIPDPEFERYLVDEAYDSDGVINGRVLTSDISALYALYINYDRVTNTGYNVKDLTGIQGFSNLGTLYINGVSLANNSAIISSSLQFLTINGFFDEIPMDLSRTPNVTNLSIKNSNINGLNLKSETTLNNILNYLELTNLPNLSCVDIDDPSYRPPSGYWVDPHIGFAVDCSLQTYIPDDNFEQHVINLGLDSALDNLVLTSNISGVINLDVSSQSISDLTGLEGFSSLQNLDVSNTGITSIDISKQTELSRLNASNTSLSAIDLNTNAKLTELDLSNTNINAIDLSTQNLLTSLNLNNINLSSLDISANTELTYLNIANVASLTSLNLSALTKLEELQLSNAGSLTTIDVKNSVNLHTLNASSCGLNNITLINNVQLQDLNLSNNNLIFLDLSNLASLININVSNNTLTDFNVKNGNNSAIIAFDATGNTSLDCIQVDNSSASYLTTWNKEATTTFGESCYSSFTYVPDDAFEQSLIDLGYDNTLDDYVLTSNIDTITALNLFDKGITDIEGIQDFVALTNLNLSRNRITTIDTGSLTELLILNLSGARLGQLDLSQNTNLRSLDVGGNLMTSLDVSNHSELATLYAYSMPNLSSLNLNNCAKLSTVYVYNNSNLPSIDLSTNINLGTARLYNCGFTELDISQNTKIQILWVFNNQLESLDFTDHTTLRDLRASNNNLSYLNVQNGNNNILTSFNVSGNPNLTCVTVDDVSYSNTNWTSKDAQTYYSVDCDPPVITLNGANPQTNDRIR